MDHDGGVHRGTVGQAGLRQRATPASRRFWVLIGCGFFCWFFGQVAWLLAGQDGVEALLAIRAENPDVPAILISGYNESSVIPRLQGQPLVRSVHKPFDLDDFRFLEEVDLGPPN